MKRVLIDEGVPHPVRGWIENADVFSVQWLGWAGIKNGELIQRVNEEGFDVVVTSDQQWSYQQNRSQWRFGVVELSTNYLPVILVAAKKGDLKARLNHAVFLALPGEIIALEIENDSKYEDVNGGDET